MLLSAVVTGPGDADRSVLLLHGMMGSAESWWRVSELLAAHGTRVIALDLPGHGLSPRDPRGSVGTAADAVVETVAALGPPQRLIGIGHSYGGTVLSAAAARLALDTQVYVDTGCAFAGGGDIAELTAQYDVDRRARLDRDRLRQSRPFYSAEDAVVEARAARRFDPVTAASVSSESGVDHRPGAGAILVRARPSRFVSDDEATALQRAGVEVRAIDGAAHSVWYSDFERFVDALPEIFRPDA
ncbi:alpha/beta hydrolase [Microbacterium sp. USHLN186]|uniref:alpha/beta hydrolase n=1 Tax=Microbacterium sp. USHLN186 TaxID=3081286 RepID=UPI003015C6A2